MLVNNNSKIYVGDTEIEKAYSGQTVVYEKSSPIVYIDYVENNRDAVIETGVVPKKNLNYKIEIQFEATSLTGGDATSVIATYDNGYCVNISTRDRYNPGVSGYNWHISYRNATITVNSLTPDVLSTGVVNTAKITFKFDKDFLNTSPICLFSQSEQGYHPFPNRHFLGKIYYCKIKENNILVRDFVPVRKNGVDGFLDKLHDEFYTFYDISNV